MIPTMDVVPTESRLTRKLIDGLHLEVTLLADEARAYFDDHGRADRDQLGPMARVGFSCEALRVTTRIMHVLAWLLNQRALLAGEIQREELLSAARRLGDVAQSEAAAIAPLPQPAQALVLASQDLYERVRRLDEELGRQDAGAGVRALMGRLERAF